MTQPVGIGLIGAGGIAQKAHLPHYKTLEAEGLARLVAVCDARLENAQAVADRFGIPHAFADYREMLALDAIDAVDVCTPNALHKQPAVDALAAGKHVLCEKPLARNAVEGAEMVAAAHASGRQLMALFNLRYGAGAQAVKRFADDGKIGEVYYARVHALRRRGVPTHGVFTDKDQQGGGPLIDIGVHMLDLTLWLMGDPKPVAVMGAAYTKFGRREGVYNHPKWGPFDPTTFSVEDFASGYVRFENGATLTLESSFLANLERDAMTSQIFGTEGGALVDAADASRCRIYREESGSLTDTQFTLLPDSGGHAAAIRGFVEALRAGTPVPIPGEQALRVTRILDALYESSETRREVQI